MSLRLGIISGKKGYFFDYFFHLKISVSANLAGDILSFLTRSRDIFCQWRINTRIFTYIFLFTSGGLE